jgi:hypothetical protein
VVITQITITGSYAGSDRIVPFTIVATDSTQPKRPGGIPDTFSINIGNGSYVAGNNLLMGNNVIST